MKLSRTVARFNKTINNRLQGSYAWLTPPWAVILHRGRRSGRAYRTPVLAFRQDGTLIIALLYGELRYLYRLPNEEAAERLVVEHLGEDAAADPEDQGVDVEQAGDQHQRQEARHDEVLDRVDAEHLQGVELLADLAGAEVGGDRGAGHAGDDHGGHERGELADRGEHEETAEAIERSEQREEVRRLQAGSAEAERQRRDHHGEPAELEGEEELVIKALDDQTFSTDLVSGASILGDGRVVLIDAHSLIYRAFFALPPMSTSDGQVTNAVYGFTSMLAIVLASRPEYAIAAFDVGAPTFRSKEYVEYKAGRRAMPDALRPQIEKVREVLESFSIPIHGIEGFEAGGQLMITSDVENYPGFKDGIQGPEMMEIFREQAKRFGTDVELDTVTEVDFSMRPFRLTLDAGGAMTADAVIISSGATSLRCPLLISRQRWIMPGRMRNAAPAPSVASARSSPGFLADTLRSYTPLSAL